MKTKRKISRQNAKQPSSASARSKKTTSFRARSNQIHDSLDEAVRKIESGNMNQKSAKEILQRIDIVETLLRAAKLELQNWLKVH